MRKHLLVTNDDGIRSGFLRALVDALLERFEVTIAAPATEQSWIGRAVSRQGKVKVEPCRELNCSAWTISGTPTDCINIALGNLLKQLPAAVVSGINIGYNTSTPLIYSSGTVAGAMEGAFWGLPAFAVSQQVADDIFGEVTRNHGAMPSTGERILRENAAHAAGLIERILHDPDHYSKGSGQHGQVPDAIVHNLNYPANPVKPYETVLTAPVPLREMAFYREDQEEKSNYRFHFQHGDPLPSEQKTDRQAIAEGLVSHSILNFSALGRNLNH